jgi:hypothetical protein
MRTVSSIVLAPTARYVHVEGVLPRRARCTHLLETVTPRGEGAVTRRLDGQVALVTGGSRGLGHAIARALAAEGASLALLARSGAELDHAVAGLTAAGSRALATPADATRADEVERAVRSVLERLGRLDIVILNAGTWQGAPIHETSRRCGINSSASISRAHSWCSRPRSPR